MIFSAAWLVISLFVFLYGVNENLYVFSNSFEEIETYTNPTGFSFDPPEGPAIPVVEIPISDQK